MNDFAPLDIGTNRLQGVYNRPHHEKNASPGNNGRLAPPVQRGSDRVELSQAAKLINRLRTGSVERQDLIAEVRTEIESGHYETNEKIDEAIDELMLDL